MAILNCPKHGLQRPIQVSGKTVCPACVLAEEKARERAEQQDGMTPEQRAYHDQLQGK